MKIRPVRPSRSRTAASVLLGALTTAAVLLAVWFPEFELWFVKPEPVSLPAMARSVTEPAVEILLEVGRMDLKPPSIPLPPDELIRLAESIGRDGSGVSGRPEEPGASTSGSPGLRNGSLKEQLIAASLSSVDRLLDAYAMTGRHAFFQLAQTQVTAFARFEASRWLDTGFLWNDHAVAARIPVLIKFWAHYRQQPDFDPETARSVLTLVARSGMLLAKPEHYAWRTGHGIVQNIGLLQISAAFPFLAESREFRDTAQRRLEAHLPYYINREGVTLLHSAGYAVGGVRFLGMAMRLYTLVGLPIPADWWSRYQKAQAFQALLRRPDGTLPMFGDTDGEADSFSPATTHVLGGGQAAALTVLPVPNRNGVGLYPAAGYAVWWYPRTTDDSAPLSQTVAAWSYYPGLGHKHADELSVLVWAGGRNWLTNVGYWPYGLASRSRAESWPGSNAPHLRDEAATSVRTARLQTTGSDDELFYIDMERLGPGGFKARREVLQLAGRIWLVLDRQDDSADREVETHWTFYPDLRVSRGDAAGRFVISPPSAGQRMRCSLQAAQGSSIEQLSGSSDPFAGWVVVAEAPVAADTIRVRSRSQRGWQLTVCDLDDGGSGARDIDVTASLSGPLGSDGWTVHIAGIPDSPGLSVVRSAEQVSVATDGSSTAARIVRVHAVADPKADVAEALAAFHASTERSERRVPLVSYRARVSYVLLGLFLIQEILLALLRRRWPWLGAPLRIGSTVAWLGAGVWLTRFYLVAG